jgi:hypothetical protein
MAAPQIYECFLIPHLLDVIRNQRKIRMELGEL